VVNVGAEPNRGHVWDPKHELAVCLVCRGAEGSLPFQCPGAAMTTEQQDAVYAARLEYMRGQWWMPMGGDK